MIYFNNGATSLIKPDIVYQSFLKAVKSFSNMGRGVSAMSMDTSRAVYESREKVAKVFNIKNPLNVGFVKNATEALNVALFGYLKQGDHVISTVSEHNSVLRPLYRLQKTKGIEFTLVESDNEGKISPDFIKNEIKDNTALIVMSHVSNVTGNIFDINKIGRIARKADIKFLVDTAQSGGIIDIDVERDCIDMLAFTGHKYLFGLQGTGGLYIADGIKVKPLMLGGSTFDSTILTPDLSMPELVEAGTQNTAGIIALGVACDFVHQNRVKIFEKEELLVKYFLQEIKKVEYLNIVGSCEPKNRVALFSFTSEKYDIHDIAEYLDEAYEIVVRTGLQCAPLIHNYVGSGKTGVLRISMSYFNELFEIDVLIKALREYA